MTRIYRRKTVIKNRRRFFAFLIISALLLNALIFGIMLPKITKADPPHDPVIVSVARGDTLWSIAQAHYGEKSDIRKYVYLIKKQNALTSAQLSVGQKLILPAD